MRKRYRIVGDREEEVVEGTALHMTEGIINSLHWPNKFRPARFSSTQPSSPRRSSARNGSAIVSRQAVSCLLFGDHDYDADAHVASQFIPRP